MLEKVDLVNELHVSLENPNKVARKKGLETFRRNLESEPPSNFLAIFEQTYKNFVTSLSDQSERCREISCQILLSFSQHMDPLSFTHCLSYLIPCLRQRLPLESGEEVRMELLILLESVVTRKAGDNLAPHIQHLVDILVVGLKDQNPALLVLTCSVSTYLSTMHPSQAKLQVSSLVSPLLPLTFHHLLKVRVAAVSCLSQVVGLVGGQTEEVEQVVSCLRPRLSDQSSKVRLEVGRTVFHWLGIFRKVDSWVEHLLPLALALLEDESEEVQGEIREQWREMECRELLRMHKDKIIEYVTRDIEDWSKENRLMGVKNIYSLLNHSGPGEVEDKVEVILQCLLTAINDTDEMKCVEMARKTSVVLSNLVTDRLWVEFIVSTMETNPSTNQLILLSCLLEGCHGGDIEVMRILIKTLSLDAFCLNNDELFQTSLLKCSRLLLKISRDQETPSNNFDISSYLFLILHSILGLSATDQVSQLARVDIKEMPSNLSMDRDGLYRREVGRMLTMFRETNPTLCRLKVLSTVLQEAGVSGLETNTGQVISLLKTNLSTPDVSQQNRQVILAMLDQLLLTRSLSLSHPEQVLEVARDLLLPATVWHTGLSEQEVRYTATSCVYHLINMYRNNNILRSLVWSRLLGLLEDKDERTRKVSGSSVCLLAEIEEDHVVLDKMIQGLTGRLGDSRGSVRKEAAKSLVVLHNLRKGGNVKEKLEKYAEDVDISNIVKEMLQI